MFRSTSRLFGQMVGHANHHNNKSASKEAICLRNEELIIT